MASAAFGFMIGFFVWCLVAVFGFKVFKKDVAMSYPKLALSFAMCVSIPTLLYIIWPTSL